MIIHFYLRFHTTFGQNIFVTGNADFLGNNDTGKAFPLVYLNEEFCHGSIELPETTSPENITYRYILRQNNEEQIIEADDKIVDLRNNSSKQIILIDTWNAPGNINNVFYSQPFQHAYLKLQNKIPKLKPAKIYTHEFKVKAPLLQPDEWVCITGSGNTFKNWDVKKLLPLKQEGNWVSIKINLSKDESPVKYKYGIYNIKNKTFKYEDGDNRVIKNIPGKDSVTIFHDGFINVQKRWKGAGVAIPIFSIRTKNGFGTGEFADIKLLADWANQTGIQLLQFLPVNDTSSTHTNLDSYPYSAISAFALHPLYINLDKVVGTANSAIIKALNKKKKQLNNLPDLNYSEVMKFKLSALNELFQAEKSSFINDEGYLDFFSNNRHWLVPYAAFCFLRDKFKTADFTQWKTYKTYNEEVIKRLVSPSEKNYDEVCVHYFTQYHLHLQLKEASEYARKKGIVLKGDIPIGISKNSCDAWVNPSLYNMDEQAGAPPDGFAIKGQNWGFPIYNWKKMKEDDFAWWRKRFAQMNNYFDVFRIDHILGFFRIWSIPKHAVEGTLGRFIPVIPVHINEFETNKIWFDYDRYCKPYITENILENQFAEHKDYVIENFLSPPSQEEVWKGYDLKEEFNTQQKIENYFKHIVIADADKIKDGLFNLVSNVILIEEENSDQQQFHFRISMHLTSSFQNLDPYVQHQLSNLYNDYFFIRQDHFWKQQALQKLPDLKLSTNMLVCGEDLGMVPHCVPEVMDELGILSLEIQRMPKNNSIEFFHPKDAKYLSVVTPSTHDMSTIRSWWQEDKFKTQRFYTMIMEHHNEAPISCEPWINKEIVLQHLQSPAMWSIFQIQDLLGINKDLRRQNPDEERINQPADPNNYWKYRMHINLEDLIKQKEFNQELRYMVKISGR